MVPKGFEGWALDEYHKFLILRLEHYRHSYYQAVGLDKGQIELLESFTIKVPDDDTHNA
jgi:hypothetical protein